MARTPTDTCYRLPADFYHELEQVLLQHPAGLGEYELLQALRERGYFCSDSTGPASSLELFQVHFLLFHSLYRLQQDYFAQQSGVLEISPLKIRTGPYHSETSALTDRDPLRDYYLDLDNLHTMSEDGVNALLDAFWREFVRFDNRSAALAELELNDPVDDQTIKQAYRRLAMEHHPDRGGEARRLQAINAAYRTLCKSRS